VSRRAPLLLGIAAIAATMLAGPAPPAAAGPLYDVRASWGDTNLPPGGRGLEVQGSLLRFGASGAKEFAAPPDHPAGVAVHPASGAVYVVDVDPGGGATLRTYTEDGAETGTPCPLDWAPDTPLPQPGVDAAGNLYYPNTQTGKVQKLEPGCGEVPLAQPIAGLDNPNSVALDAAGNIYVVEGTSRGSDIASGELQKFAPNGEPLGSFLSGEVTAVSLDRSTGEVFVGRGWGAAFRIERRSSGGSLLTTFGAGKFATQSASEHAYNQLAVDETTKTVYAANVDAAVLGEPGEVKVFTKGFVGYATGTPLRTGSLTTALAVNQVSSDLYAASAGALNNLAQFELQVRNIGDAVAAQELTITDQLPAGVTVADVVWVYGTKGPDGKKPDISSLCTGKGTGKLTCKMPGSLLAELVKLPPHPDSYLPQLHFTVSVAPGASGTGTNLATVSGGGAPEPFTDQDEVNFDPAPSPFGVRAASFLADNFSAEYPFGQPTRQAGDHPFELRVDFEFNQHMVIGRDGTRIRNSNGFVRTVEATLPRGMIGNPEATPKCDPVDFARYAATAEESCPSDTQVGYLSVPVGNDLSDYGSGDLFPNPNNRVVKAPIYSLVPPRGVPADFAFNAEGVQGHIYPVLDPAQNYAIKAVTPNIGAPLLYKARSAEVTFWGVPGDAAHDRYRRHQENAVNVGAPWGSAPIRPLLTNPTDCDFDNGGARIRLESYGRPGVFTPVTEYGDPLNVTGCNDPRFRFEPQIALQPTSRAAGGPTGLDVHLEVPQRNDQVDDAEELYAENGFVKAIPTPPMKRAVVTFPEGMTISPSAAQGLGTCSPEQIGLGTDKPVTCPDNSQYGTLTLHTPILPIDEQPEGFVYVAKQGDNPFHNFLSLYLVIQEPDRGILVKIPGRVDLDPATGQITTTFDDLPQFPVSDFQMTLKGGVRAALVNPATCGKKTIRAEFFSWHDPGTPQVVTDSYQVTNKPDGSACVNHLVERPFNPALSAGTLSNSAGTYSPFVFRLTRTDDDQEFSQLDVTMPQGLIGKLAGVGECPEAGIAQAIGRVGAGDGALERANPSCPDSSLIGTTNVGAGVGVPLTYVPGKVYLAGPYQGAPLSMVVISPAIVGPYDLGVIAVRSALHVDPETTQVSVASDPFPLIYQGIPVRIRDIRVNVDRPEFILNPTSCAGKQVDARITGTGGDLKSTADDTAAELSNRFQAADCASLGFKPKLGFRLFGGTRRGAHPKLRAVLRMPAGGANMARASVALPRSQFLDQAHIRTVCTRVQFAQDACPKGSIYGHAVAKSPLLDEALRGPIYLRSSSNPLPDLVVALKGPPSQPVEVNLVGRIDSVRLRRTGGSGIRTSFAAVPDAPVSSFVLTMRGGRKGLLVNSTNLCRRAFRVKASLRAQSGRRATLRPKLRSRCAAKRRNHHRR
jgi:hypothetical protein